MKGFREKASRELAALRRVTFRASGLTTGERNAILNRCDRLSSLIRKEAAGRRPFQAKMTNTGILIINP